MLSYLSDAQVAFDRYFNEGSLRIDFITVGNSQSQKAIVHQLREEPVWGGPRANLIEQFG